MMTRAWIATLALATVLITSGCNIMPRAKQEDVLQVRRLLVVCNPPYEFTDVYLGITAFGNQFSTRPMPADLCTTRMVPAFVAALKAERPEVETIVEAVNGAYPEHDAIVRLSVASRWIDFVASSNVTIGGAGVYKRNSPFGDRVVVYGVYGASLSLLKIETSRDRPSERVDNIKCVKRLSWEGFDGDFAAVTEEQWREANGVFDAMTEAAMSDLARSIYSKFEPSLMTEHRNCGGWT
jgi:hypothetical protein